MADTTKTIMPLGAAAQADNYDLTRSDYIRPDQHDRPITTKTSAAEIRAIGLVVGGLGAGLLVLLSLVQWVSCWNQSYDLTRGCVAASILFWGYVSFVVVLALAGALVLLWGRVARVQAETARANITRDRYSNPVSVRAVHDLSIEQTAAFFAMAQQAEIAMAPYKMLPAGLDVYNQSSAPAAPSVITPPIEMPSLIPDQEWLSWLTEMPHTMIAGMTNSGKTTMARVEMIERLSLDYAGIVLDPKGKEWFGLPVIGGGRKFAEILTMLDQIHAEMEARFVAYGNGERSFQPIKVLVDEVPDIMDSCLDMRRRLVDGRWSRFARQLGSLAREIGISVTLMTQSPNVEDIGMNGAMRKNFNRLALGDEVAPLIAKEGSPKRRAALQDLLRGQQHPAAMVRRGEVYLLDTSNVVQLSERAIVRPVGWAPAHATLSAITYPAWAKGTNSKIAFLLHSGHSYRQIERELNVSHQTIRQVNVALQARRKAAESATNG